MRTNGLDGDGVGDGEADGDGDGDAICDGLGLCQRRGLIRCRWPAARIPTFAAFKVGWFCVGWWVS